MSTSTGKPHYAFARVDKLYTMAELVRAQLHADRDPSATFEVRLDTSPDRDQIRWTRGAGYGVFELVEGWRRAKGSARERKRAPVCLHLILGISPEWVQLSGRLHDQVNPGNLALLEAAGNFVETQIGRVAAVRLDLDEVGGGVVDVFCVPVFERARRLRKDGSRSDDGIPEISANKAFERLREQTRERGDYSALQTAWAGYVRAYLDPKLVRGQRKHMTGRRHLETPEYKALLAGTEALEKRAHLAKAEIARLEVEDKKLEADRQLFERRAEAVARKEQQYRSEIDQEVQAIARAWAKWASGAALADADHAALRAPMAVEASAELEAAISKIKAETAAKEKHEADIRREEERVAGLRIAAEERQRELDKREEKVANDEEAFRTRDDEARARVADLTKKESQLRVAKQEALTATEHATYLMEEALSLKGRIMAALHAILRRWRGGSEQGDEELLNHADVANLTEAANVIQEEIDKGQLGLETMKQSITAEIEGMQALAKRQSDEKDAEITRKTAEITERETTHQGVVAKHGERVAADIDRIRRFLLALRRHLIGVPTVEDQAILDHAMFADIRVQVDATRKALDADITEKRETRDKLVAESLALEQKSVRIRTIGAALADWTAGKRSDELKTTLEQPEAKPFVDAFNAVWSALRSRWQATEEKEKSADAKAKESEKNQQEASEMLTKTKNSASDLADLIESNCAKAEELERQLRGYAEAFDYYAALRNRPSPVPDIEQTVADAKAQAPNALRLRKSSVSGGFERD